MKSVKATCHKVDMDRLTVLSEDQQKAPTNQPYIWVPHFLVDEHLLLTSSNFKRLVYMPYSIDLSLSSALLLLSHQNFQIYALSQLQVLVGVVVLGLRSVKFIPLYSPLSFKVTMYFKAYAPAGSG